MLNPLTEEFGRIATARALRPISNLIQAVDIFAYFASAPIEYELGERAEANFDKAALVHEIKENLKGENYLRWSDIFTTALNNSGLPREAGDSIFRIIEEEALARIEQAIDTDGNGKAWFVEHRHHGRQYIARNSTARVVREVLPAYVTELTPEGF